jgi:uncharacterized YigZ family protein
MIESSYLVPADTTFYQQEIKRSKFLTWIAPIDSPECAKQWIQARRDEYPDARHICWAYIAGSPNTSLKSMSDDGEPNGTAGKPMLNVLEHSDVGDIVAVVVRYFGGIKLGTGGLVRAYSSSVSTAMQQTVFITKVAKQELRLQFPYSDEAQVRYLLKDEQGEVLAVQYSDSVQFQCQLPRDNITAFKQRLGFNVVVLKTIEE